MKKFSYIENLITTTSRVRMIVSIVSVKTIGRCDGVPVVLEGR